MSNINNFLVAKKKSFVPNLVNSLQNALTKLNRPYELKEYDKYHSFLLHYPEITITNGKTDQILYDLFVVIEITADSINYYGARTSFLIDELNCAYVHSHLPANRDICFQNLDRKSVV